ncbi:MAG: hypothetical protein CMJ64_05955 [Planctomycetaceae bacterium]|nr:hypothetical protein [Planctomycetaceae bacterium]
MLHLYASILVDGLLVFRRTRTTFSNDKYNVYSSGGDFAVATTAGVCPAGSLPRRLRGRTSRPLLAVGPFVGPDPPTQTLATWARLRRWMPGPFRNPLLSGSKPN